MQNNGNYICPICKKEMIWDSDADSDEAGYFAPGYVMYFHCERCNAQFEIFIEKEDEQ